MWEIAIPIIGAVVGAGMDYFGGKKEAEAGKANTAAMREETQESLRRFEYQIERNNSTRIALSSASGLKQSAGGSQQLAMEAMAGEEWKEYNWLKKSGASMANIEAARGRAAAWQGYARAATTLTSGGTAVGSLGRKLGYW